VCRLCKLKNPKYGICPCGCGKPKGKNGCTAHSKRTKILCNGHAIRGAHCCRVHGGKALKGFAHPSTTHGEFSKHLPARYLDVASRALDSENLRTNRNQIALMDSRADELFSKLADGGHGESLKVALASAKKLRGMTKDAKRLKVLDEMIEVLKQGIGEDLIWNDLLDLWEQRRKTVDTDSKIAFRKSVALSAEQALALAAVVVQAARDFIRDPNDLRAFASRIEANTPGGLVALDESDYHVSG